LVQYVWPINIFFLFQLQWEKDINEIIIMLCIIISLFVQFYSPQLRYLEFLNWNIFLDITQNITIKLYKISFDGSPCAFLLNIILFRITNYWDKFNFIEMAVQYASTIFIQYLPYHDLSDLDDLNIGSSVWGET